MAESTSAGRRRRARPSKRRRWTPVLTGWLLRRRWNWRASGPKASNACSSALAIAGSWSVRPGGDPAARSVAVARSSGHAGPPPGLGAAMRTFMTVGAHGDRLAHQVRRHRIAVGVERDPRVRTDHGRHDFVGVERDGRQRPQQRSLLLETIDRPLAGGFVQADVGDSSRHRGPRRRSPRSGPVRRHGRPGRCA